jgi:NAD(P)-dependent dehydrogenase (short-subunit alcohol dehydrogenase family)
MKFTAAQLQAFERLSFDVNPLHVDAAYARRTQFGQVVVYGLCAVLHALGEWAKGRSFRLSSINANFARPLFLHEDYQLEITEADGAITAIYRKGETHHAKIKFLAVMEMEHASPRTDGNPIRTSELRSLSVHPMPETVDRPEIHYSIRSGDGMSSHFGLDAHQLPREQLNALVWSSYFVGMEYPGRQALFAELGFTFSPAPAGNESAGLTLRDVQGRFDDRINQVTITGRGTGIDRFEIKAFRRPEPVEYSRAVLTEAARGLERAFEGKKVLITGAGRGFGAVMARMLAICGARVLLNCREDSPEVRAMAQEQMGQVGTIEVLAADIGSKDGMLKLCEGIRRSGGGLDYLIANAFPTVGFRRFSEQEPGEFLNSVGRSLVLTNGLLSSCFPLLSSDATLVAISSIYTEKPQPGFTHYITAKSAVEGLFRGLSCEYPKHRFIIARPPRMLTDQTNLAFDRTPPVPAPTVAHDLLSRLISPRGSTPNLQEVNLHG